MDFSAIHLNPTHGAGLQITASHGAPLIITAHFIGRAAKLLDPRAKLMHDAETAFPSCKHRRRLFIGSFFFVLPRRSGKHDDAGGAHHRSDAGENQKGELHPRGLGAIRHVRSQQHNELAGKLPWGRGAAAEHHTPQVGSQRHRKHTRRCRLCTGLIFIMFLQLFFFNYLYTIILHLLFQNFC